MRRQKRISVTRQFDRDGQVQEGGRGTVVGRNVIGGVVTDHPARKSTFQGLGPAAMVLALLYPGLID